VVDDVSETVGDEVGVADAVDVIVADDVDVGVGKGDS